MSSSSSTAAPSSAEDSNGPGIVTRYKRLRGMRARDEFLCPITFELMVDPVVAADGFTYERAAIETWMRTKDNSPRTREPLTNKTVIPNINLKRLMKDLISEGGAGLYMPDAGDHSRVIELRPQKLLILRCEGPAESEWWQRKFQVGCEGCVGGRKQPELAPGQRQREFILFKDNTVSRKHFEIYQDPMSEQFMYRDLGSAGGSFVRILPGSKKSLHPGVIILIGKHQFTVSSIDTAKKPKRAPSVSEHKLGSSWGGGDFASDSKGGSGSGSAASSPSYPAERKGSSSNSGGGGDDADGGSDGVLLARMVSEAEAFINALESINMQDEGSRAAALASLRDERTRAFQSRINSVKSSMHVPSNAAKEHQQQHEEEEYKYGPSADAHNAGSSSNSGGKDSKADGGDSITSGGQFDHYSLTLTCFAPDGSPIQGRNYHVGSRGAFIGRNTSHLICMCLKASEDPNYVPEEAKDGDRLLNIDSAVSTDHARIEMDPSSGEFYICDGAQSKPSTNGTWYRLSGPHQESPPHVIDSSMEILVGTVRFSASITDTITETMVDTPHT